MEETLENVVDSYLEAVEDSRTIEKIIQKAFMTLNMAIIRSTEARVMATTKNMEIAGLENAQAQLCIKNVTNLAI